MTAFAIALATLSLRFHRKAANSKIVTGSGPAPAPAPAPSNRPGCPKPNA
nr:hypothetical protein OH820_14280 [Streptomyces sp. NBC_00857]